MVVTVLLHVLERISSRVSVADVAMGPCFLVQGHTEAEGGLSRPGSDAALLVVLISKCFISSHAFRGPHLSAQALGGGKRHNYQMQ